MIFQVVKIDYPTNGPASPYRSAQLTGAASAVLDTGNRLTLGIIPVSYPVYLLPISPVETRADLQEGLDEDSDPALAPFAGPLGKPRTHSDCAVLFQLNYRPAPDEFGYVDVPEEVL